MKTRFLSVLLILVFITACNTTFEVGIEHTPSDSIGLSANPTDVVKIATVPPTAVPDVLPALATPATIITLAPTTVSTLQMVKIFVIAVDDNGQTGMPVGCGDSAVPVWVEISPTRGVMKAALEALLSVKDQYYGQSGLYNALYQSDLQVDSVSIDNNGKARVNLIGSLKMGGECDTPRVQAQLEQTVRQFPTVAEVAIFINDKPLADALSMK